LSYTVLGVELRGLVIDMFPQLRIPVPPNFDHEKEAAGRRQHAQVESAL